MIKLLMPSRQEWLHDMINEGSDEREVSWKVLLPAPQGSRLLALGMRNGDIHGLARTFSHVDIFPDAQAYEAIVFGDQEFDPQIIDKALSQVISNSILVAYGSIRNRNTILQSRWQCVAEYACLPASQPRIFLPLASKAARNIALGFHSPGSLHKKAWLWIAKRLSSVGVTAHLRRNTVRFFSAGNQMNGEDTLKEWISQRTGWPVDEVIVYAGSESPARKITVLGISSDGSKQIVARIADTDLAVVAIKQESAALRTLAQSPLAGSVPFLIAEGAHGPYFIQLQSCLPKASGQCRTLSNAHIGFLSELTKINRSNVPFGKTKEWAFIDDAATAATVGELPACVSHIVSDLEKSDTAERMVDCYMTHGDFAPWNIIDQKGSILVYDWEDSNPEGFPFHDIFHFIYRQASLVGPWHGAKTVMQMMRHAAERLANVSQIMCDPDFALSVWCIREYFCKADPRLIDLAGAIAKIKHE